MKSVGKDTAWSPSEAQIEKGPISEMKKNIRQELGHLRVPPAVFEK